MIETAVLGGGLAGLVAACAAGERGYRVQVFEAGERPGGVVGALSLAGIELDSGAESFALRGGTVRPLLDELGLGDDIVEPNEAGAWLQLPDRAVPTPKAGLLGIPSSPLARDVVAAIGWPAALRAQLDAYRPMMRAVRGKTLGELVRSRMGGVVLERLVNPVVQGVYSASADDLEVDAIAPGLAEAMYHTGSLASAVARLRGERSKAGSQVASVRGGMHRVIDALSERIAEQGGTVTPGSRVVGLERTPNSWRIAIVDAFGETVHEARSVIVALPQSEALALLGGLRRSQSDTDASTPEGSTGQEARAERPDLADLRALAREPGWNDATTVDLATLVIGDARLDAFPRGTGVLVADGAPGVSAKAMTHVSAKWAWVREALPGAHIVRLSYGRPGDPDSRLAHLSDEDARARAIADARTLFGIPDLADPAGFARVTWQQAQPLTGEGTAERLGRLTAALAPDPTIALTGAWVAGTGFARVVPAARRAGAEVRWIVDEPDPGGGGVASSSPATAPPAHHHTQNESRRSS